jgi:hypothetical protein
MARHNKKCGKISREGVGALGRKSANLQISRLLSVEFMKEMS